MLLEPHRPLARQLLGRSLDAHRVTAIWTLALLAPLLCMLLARGVSGALSWAIASGVALAWQALFARLRKRAFQPDGWLSAGAVVLLTGAELPLPQLLLSLSLGVVLGEQVFGGRGRHLVNPAVVALAFQQFLFPGSLPTVDYPGLVWAVIAGSALLLASGLISWRVVLAAAVGLALALLIGQAPLAAGFSAALCFGVVFLAADPVANPGTPLGRWLCGLLLGLLAGLFGLSAGTPGSTSSWVSAALLAALFAPLIERISIVWHLHRQRSRDACT